jgi:DNA polymerase III delta prime subunit
MAEVSDDQLAQFQRGMALLEKLNGNPEAKKSLERAIKVVHPEVQTEEEVAERMAKPYVDQFQGLTSKLEERLAKIDEREAAAAEREQVNALESAVGRLRSAGYTDEGLEQIKKLAVERSIPDLEAAAALFDKQNPPAPAQQAGWVPDHWSNSDNGDTDTKALFANEDKWADREAVNVLNEIRLAGAA